MQASCLAEIIRNNVIQYGFIVSDDLMAVSPVLQCHIDDGHGAMAPLVLIGFYFAEPVYRTTHTLAHRKNTHDPLTCGDVHIRRHGSRELQSGPGLGPAGTGTGTKFTKWPREFFLKY
jgi:hypothetical protein